MMQGLQQLHDALSELREQRKTAQIAVFGILNGSSHTVNFILRDGALSAIRHFPQTTRILDTLNALDISTVLIGKSGNGDNPGHACDLPELTTILNLLEQRIDRSDPELTSRGILLTEVRQLLHKVYGVSIDAKLERIAEQYPPAGDPIGFLDHCRVLVEATYGKRVAGKMFDPLYEQSKALQD